MECCLLNSSLDNTHSFSLGDYGSCLPVNLLLTPRQFPNPQVLHDMDVGCRETLRFQHPCRSHSLPLDVAISKRSGNIGNIPSFLNPQPNMIQILAGAYTLFPLPWSFSSKDLSGKWQQGRDYSWIREWGTNRCMTIRQPSFLIPKKIPGFYLWFFLHVR